MHDMVTAMPIIIATYTGINLPSIVLDRSVQLWQSPEHDHCMPHYILFPNIELNLASIFGSGMVRNGTYTPF
jgi:hypothetical protein